MRHVNQNGLKNNNKGQTIVSKKKWMRYIRQLIEYMEYYLSWSRWQFALIG